MSDDGRGGLVVASYGIVLKRQRPTSREEIERQLEEMERRRSELERVPRRVVPQNSSSYEAVQVDLAL